MIKNKRKETRLRRLSVVFTASALALLLSCTALLGVCDYIIPDGVSVYSDDAGASLGLPIIKLVCRSDSEAVAASSFGVASTEREASLLGVIPLKRVEVNVYDRLMLTPGGMPFGVKLYTKGIIVAEVTEVVTDSGTFSPASDAGIRRRDVILEANGSPVNSADELTSLIETSDGASLSLTVDRSGERLDITLTPLKSSEDGKYKAGIWIRDSTAGIGTVTFIDPETGGFGGLGHGICDVDTGALMPLLRGSVTDVTISGITKGRAGTPGELKGYFTSGKTGSLSGNTDAGVFGILSDVKNAGQERLPIALRGEVHEGEAEIRCTLDDNTIGKYSAVIEKINPNEGELKNFVIRITDPHLLEVTGGIVQGMSGSPVIQDGRLVGAVTHVLINDPTRGYGIFIENMLDAAA